LNRKPTIKDIAKLVGVTPATVSYVLHSNNRVGEETKNRVLSAIKELNYKPNMSARALVNSRTHSIGLFIPTSARGFLDPFFAELLRGMTEIALNYGYVTTIIYSGEKINNRKSLQIRERVDGLVITDVKVQDENIMYFQNENIPFVALGKGNYTQFQDYIIPDTRKGLREMMKYLYRLGHRRFGMILGPLGYEYVQMRYKIYREIQEELGIRINLQCLATGANSIEGGESATQRIVRSSGTLQTAILASTDIMAIGSIQYLQSIGYEVPDDVTVVGFDDTQIAQYIHPSLTTVRLNIYETGRRAAIMLISKLEGLDYHKPIHLPVKLVIRNSSSIAKPNV